MEKSLISEKVALIDVDGVLFRNKKLLSYVSHKAVKYLQKKMPKLQDYNDASYYNSLIYNSYGHTARGLSIINNNPEEIIDYNDFVYNNNMINHLQISLINEYRQTEKIINELKPFVNHCIDNDISMYLFSNAPNKWCYPIYENLKLKYVIPEENILTSDWKLFNNRVKPEPKLYTDISKYIELKEKSNNILFYFIDDSDKNLYPVRYNNKWKTILFKDNFHNITKYIN